MHKRIRIYLLLLCVIGSCVLAPVVQAQEETPLAIQAKAAIAIDSDTGKIFYEQDATTPLHIASTTKLLSMYIIYDQIRTGKLSMTDQVTISAETSALSQNWQLSNVLLYEGQSYSVKNLIEAGFLESANAAVMALAEKVAGSEAAFVDLMRAQLTAWGITDGTIVTSTGLNNAFLGDDRYPGSGAEEENQLSAKDLAIVTRHLLQDFPEVLQISSQSQLTFTEPTGESLVLENTNQMLAGMAVATDGVDGLKTGTTDLAGACFVGTVKRGDTRLITVVLNVTDATGIARFTETARMMEWVYSQWQQQTIDGATLTIPKRQTISVKDGKQLKVAVGLDNEVTVWVKKGMDATNITVTPTFTKTSVTAPVKKDKQVGTAVIRLTEDTLGYLDQTQQPKTTIVVQKAVSKANSFELGWRKVKNFFT
ncbi:D-alanyl-D-alanine carboxypeptidase [Enterococcus italicus]|uniref:serine hydrolase n=1 Tax=Enterococcus italicus TaxID=246144 RepID=UPI002072CE15|nr:serine hydrolase [Enterococcus italicus]MCM6932037.1 D-alanyl-D-alanine carboxypeptidase [Enterococcus italicus]